MGKIQEGSFVAKITSVDFTPSNKKNASPNDFNIVLGLTDDNGNTETCYLECSNNYGVGNNAGKTQLQIALDTLSSIGWPHKFGIQDAMEFGELGRIVGTQVSGTVKKSVKGTPSGEKKEYTNVYIGRSVLSADDTKSRLAALTGKPVPQQPTPQGQPSNPPQAF